MGALWKLPCIYVCENNLYGMGTSNERSAANTKYYTRGDVIPGFKADGQNVIVVRESMKFAKQWCLDGKGPIFIEFDTYRYHGHSMSDPGITYRTRDEVAGVRGKRDPMEVARKIILENGWATEKEMKDEEKRVRKEIEQQVEQIRKDPMPEMEDLYAQVTVGKPYIRGVEYKLT